MQKIITKRKNGTIRVQTLSSLPSKTDQSFKDECDVNNIVNTFMKTGQLKQGKQGAYGDVSEIPRDLLEITQTIQKAHDSFMELPAEAREKFNNDPNKMISFLQDPKNSKEAVRLGLLNQVPETKNELNELNTAPQQQTPKPKASKTSKPDSVGSADE